MRQKQGDMLREREKLGLSCDRKKEKQFSCFFASGKFAVSVNLMGARSLDFTPLTALSRDGALPKKNFLLKPRLSSLSSEAKRNRFHSLSP